MTLFQNAIVPLFEQLVHIDVGSKQTTDHVVPFLLLPLPQLVLGVLKNLVTFDLGLLDSLYRDASLDTYFFKFPLWKGVRDVFELEDVHFDSVDHIRSFGFGAQRIRIHYAFA